MAIFYRFIINFKQVFAYLYLNLYECSLFEQNYVFIYKKIKKIKKREYLKHNI